MTLPRAAALLFLVALLGGGGACDSTKGATAPVCCPPDKPLTDGCAHLGGAAIAGAAPGVDSCSTICDWGWCATNIRLERDDHGCEVWRYDTRTPRPGESPICWPEPDAGRVTDAGPDAATDASATSPFCEGLAHGATFASTDLLWCSVGWGGPGAAPSPTQAPELYCHWTLVFQGANVAWTQTDYTASGPFTCGEGGAFTALGDAGTWDAARGVLTFSGDEYRPSLPDASTGRL